MKYTLESMFGIKNRVVAVTGGCGGIGMGLAEALASLGAKVAIIDINKEKCDKVAVELIEKTKGCVKGFAADITDEVSVRAAFREIYEVFGSIYGLVNCAGISHVEYLSTMAIDAWQKVMDVNVRGSVIATKVAGEYMSLQNEGRVINISSLAATHGKPGYTAYTPSKAAINSFTFTLAAEWGRKHINVNSIAPVFVLTDINREHWKDVPDITEKIADMNPQGRICSPNLLAGLMVFLLSEASSYVNGQNIGCDGGCTNGDISAMFRPEGA